MIAHLNDTAITAVSYSHGSSWDWMRVMVRSLRKYIVDKLIIVNHSNNPYEKAWLASQRDVVILDNHDEGSHGGGLDRAVAYCRKHTIKRLVIIEPDCVILGPRWFERLLDALNEENCWMAGTYRFDYGPIHPCVSAWLVDHIPQSFTIQPIESQPDQDHFSYRMLAQWGVCHAWAEWQYRLMLHIWDCGLRNWYELALLNKAKFVNVSDIVHFWRGSGRSPRDEDIIHLTGPYVDS